MRGLRRIADKTKFDTTSAHANGSDHDVRAVLGAPSLQCILLQRRLLLFASVLRNGSRGLKTLLSARARDGTPLPWVRLVRSDLQHLASFNADKVTELGDPLQNFDAWAYVAAGYPREWRALVKRCQFTSMDLDVASKVRCNAGEWGSQPILGHTCTLCSASFATAKALESHRRVRHKMRAPLATLVGSSKVCPCCHTEFSSRPRLLAHISEKRNRGNRLYSCNSILAAGLVQPPQNSDLEAAFAADREARTAARKAGHTVPLSECLAKRPRTGTSVLAQQTARKRLRDAGVAVTTLPTNALFLDELKPLKRMRTKSSQELVVLQHLA